MNKAEVIKLIRYPLTDDVRSIFLMMLADPFFKHIASFYTLDCKYLYIDPAAFPCKNIINSMVDKGIVEFCESEHHLLTF